MASTVPEDRRRGLREISAAAKFSRAIRLRAVRRLRDVCRLLGESWNVSSVSRTAWATHWRISFAMEFHFAFRRVNVHVHFRGIHFNEQTADRKAPFHQRGVIAFEQREINSAIFHRPPVDEKMLALAGRSRNPGRTNQTPERKLRTALPGFGEARLEDVGFFRLQQ